MLAKILFDTDLHKKYSEPESVKNYLTVTDLIQLDRIRFIRQEGITHYVHGGDLYDRGYYETQRTMNDFNLDRAISDAVNGNAYLCVGNHMFIERDNNPEFYIIQPNDNYRPVKRFIAFKPIFQAVETLKIGTVQISFMHFNKEELYFPRRDEDTTFHIAVFHTDKLLPNSMRVEAGYFGQSSDNYISSTLDGVDLAIFAHIHVPLGTRRIGGTTLIVPGSAMVTKNDAREKHKSIDLPVITINDDCSCSLSMHTFSTYMDQLQFHEVRKKKKTLGVTGERVVPQELFTPQTRPKATNLREFMSLKGYTDNHIQLLEECTKKELGFADAYNILRRN